MTENWFYILLGGFVSGILAGLLGIGGGLLLVSLLRAFGYNYSQAIATSSLAIVITSTSGSFQNWRMGYLKIKRILLLGLPAIFTTLIGTYLVTQIPEYLLQSAFGCLLFLNIYLTNLGQNLTENKENINLNINPYLAILITGGLAGLLAGLFGVGGGVILVPLQILFLREKIKQSIQNSLGVVMLTSIFACFGHYQSGSILFSQGIMLGIGGLIGVQFSTRFLPKISDKSVKLSFNFLLIILGVYAFYLVFKSF